MNCVLDVEYAEIGLLDIEYAEIGLLDVEYAEFGLLDVEYPDGANLGQPMVAPMAAPVL